MTSTPMLLRILGRSLRRPAVLGAMMRASWRFRARGWWRRAPFLPLPPREYVDWRLHTAYGDQGREPTVAELGRYFRWANRMHRTRHSEVRSR